MTQDIALLEAQFNQVKSENEHVVGSLDRRPGTEGGNFTAADPLVAFGGKNDRYLVGHPLVCQSQMPNNEALPSLQRKETGSAICCTACCEHGKEEGCYKVLVKFLAHGVTAPEASNSTRTHLAFAHPNEGKRK